MLSALPAAQREIERDRLKETRREGSEMKRAERVVVVRKVESETKERERGRHGEMDNEDRQSRIFHPWNISHFT